MKSNRYLRTGTLLFCAAISGCYINAQGVDQGTSDRITALEQRMYAVERTLGMPSPPPPQVESSSGSDSPARSHVKHSDYRDDESKEPAAKEAPGADEEQWEAYWQSTRRKPGD
jgi:hypothetical protein